MLQKHKTLIALLKKSATLIWLYKGAFIYQRRPLTNIGASQTEPDLRFQFSIFPGEDEPHLEKGAYWSS